MNKLRFLFSLTVISVVIFALAGNTLATGPSGIVYDAEFQKVFKQHADKWAEEDKQIERKLEALRKKHGKRPNIIHIMWDDMKYGAIGHDMLNKVTGYSSPNINKLEGFGLLT